MYNLSVGRTVHPWGTGHLCSPYQHNLQGDKVLIMRICKVDGCEGKHEGLGYCYKHYIRFKKYGDHTISHKPMKPTERHGLRKVPEYGVWDAMIQRCTNPNNKKYHRYGGRGITVCDRWRNSFQAFYTDMGQRPFPKAQIDRVNNNGNYEPNNCKWVTSAYNNQHTSRTKLSIAKAREIRKSYGVKTARELSKKYDIAIQNIYEILHNRIWKEV